MSDPERTSTELSDTGSKIDQLATAMRGAGTASEAGRGAVRISDQLSGMRMLEAVIDVLRGERHSAEETEASAIFERIDRELPSVEERTDRLMHQYGL
jgi:hypothetical protein